MGNNEDGGDKPGVEPTPSVKSGKGPSPRSLANLAPPFEKGRSGNPKGPRKNPWGAFMREAALDKGGKDTGKIKGRILMERMYDEATGAVRCKNPSAVQQNILHYWLGRPKVSLEVSGPDKGPVPLGLADFLNLEQIEQLHGRVIAASKAESEE